jgi:hypothetical protein
MPQDPKIAQNSLLALIVDGLTTLATALGATGLLATKDNQTNGAQKAMVYGEAAVGAVPVGNPVPVAGLDAAGKVAIIQTTADGLKVQQADPAKLAVTEASATSILARLTSLAADGILVPKTINAVAVADGGEVQITGLTANGYYRLAGFYTGPHTGGGIATHRLRRLYKATGGAVADLRWEEPVAAPGVPVADGVSYPYEETGGAFVQADAAGILWLRYTVTGGGTITEVGELYLLPRRTA